LTGRIVPVILLLAVLVCTGVISGIEGIGFRMEGKYVPGLILMILSIVCLVAGPKIAGKFSGEKRSAVNAIIRLASVIICGVGAIVVFCG